jgi:hypothetical protein
MKLSSFLRFLKLASIFSHTSDSPLNPPPIQPEHSIILFLQSSVYFNVNAKRVEGEKLGPIIIGGIRDNYDEILQEIL